MKISTGNRIDGVLGAIKEASCYDDIKSMMREFRRGHDDIAVFGAYRLQLQSVANLEREYEGLMKVQSLNLSSSSKVLEFIRKSEGYGVLVTTIDGVSDAELRSASFGAGIPLTTEEVRNALRADVEKLRGAGLWNEMLERGGAWLLNPETKRVIISSWAQVAPADQNTLQAGCEQVLRMIDHA
jgi:hypothetical protein